MAKAEGQKMSYAWLLPPKVRTRLGLVRAALNIRDASGLQTGDQTHTSATQ